MKILRQFILENWTLKLMSIFLAWILWLFVRAETGGERVITIPLEVQISRNMEITNERPNSVDVTVRGTVSNVWFGQALPTCSIDLQGLDEGEHVVPLTPENVRIPRASGLEVLKVSPARVNLVLERSISREVPVVVPTRGEPTPGFDIYGKFAIPSMILITGPRSHVQQIEHISSEPVSLTGQKQSLRVFANLSIRDSRIRSTPVGPIEVQVTIGVHRKQTVVSRVPVQVDDSRYMTAPQRISVEILVPVDFKGSLTPADISAAVSTTALDESKLPVRVKPEVKFLTRLDPGIVIKEIQPPEVTVRRK